MHPSSNTPSLEKERDDAAGKTPKIIADGWGQPFTFHFSFPDRKNALARENLSSGLRATGTSGLSARHLAFSFLVLTK
jgi:hypothetical protein